MNAAQHTPLAHLFGQLIAQDETDRAIEFASLQARFTAAESRRVRIEAIEHARQCIDTCESQSIEYDAETLSLNIESNFPELDIDDCDDIARAAIAKATGSAL